MQYAQARVHPYQLLLRDILDAEFAVLYLSEEEFSSRTEPPQDVRRSGEHRGEEESFSAWALANRQQPLDRKLALVGWVPTMTRMPVRPRVMCLRMLTRRLVI